MASPCLFTPVVFSVHYCPLFTVGHYAGALCWTPTVVVCLSPFDEALTGARYIPVVLGFPWSVQKSHLLAQMVLSR